MGVDPHPLRGMALLLCSLFFFAALDATAKYLAATYSVPLLVWARYLVHCLLMVVFLAPRHGWTLLATRRLPAQALRGLMLVGCTGCGIAALSRMPLAETTAVAFSAPLIVALLAGPWLGERLPPARWAAIVIGFLGVLLIARPGGYVTLAGVVLALLAATFYAIYQILTRQLASTERTVTMVFYTALAGTVCMSPLLPWFWRDLPAIPAGDALLICALGLLGGSGHYLLTRAFRHAPASMLSPFIYVQLIWATLLGAAVFGHWPDAFSFAGMAVIVACGLWLALSARRPNPDRGTDG